MRISPQNVGSFLASGFAAQVAAAIAGLLLVRWMSAADLAIYTICVHMVGTVYVLTRGGVGPGLAAAIARFWPDRQGAAGTVDAAKRVRLIISALTMPPILALTWFLLNRTGAPALTIGAIVLMLAVLWLADFHSALIDQVLFFDSKAVRVQVLDGVIAWARLALICLLRVAGAVSALTALAANVLAVVARAPFIRRWVTASLGSRRETASPETVQAIASVARRQIPIDLFLTLQTQVVLFYLTRNGGGMELATFGALARIAQLLTPFHAVIVAYFVPHFAKTNERVAVRLAGYVAFGALPGVALLLLAIVAPQSLLYFIGPTYADQAWPLVICAAMIAVTTAVEIAVILVSHRGWNRRGWVRIVLGTAWLAIAPAFIAVDTAAGAYLFAGGFSIGTVVALVLELRLAQKAGEIRLGPVLGNRG